MKLKSFDDIWNMCQDRQWMQQYVHSQTLVLTDSQKQSVNYLKNELRNKLEHYVPTSWSIEIHGLPEIASDYFDVIRFLAVESGNLIHLEEYEIERTKVLCESGKALASSSKLFCDLQENVDEKVR